MLQISRQGENAVHFVPEPIAEGAEAELKVDWTRRFDHMQQHSGDVDSSLISSNFLLTASTENLYRSKRRIYELSSSC